MSDFVEGYLDGRDLDAPTPSDNRSDEYKHSFDVGRREKSGSVLPAQAYRQRIMNINSEELKNE